MKPLIVVSSKTGNTRIVAHFVADAMGGALCAPADLPEDLSGFDPVILGFWCDRGMAPEDMKAAAPKITGKRVGCFCTLGGNPEADWAKEWMEKTSKELAGEKNELVATFVCRGRIDPELIVQMDRMSGKDPSPETVARRRASETHPDRVDCQNAADVFTKAFGA